jgi:hypothetical protein
MDIHISNTRMRSDVRIVLSSIASVGNQAVRSRITWELIRNYSVVGNNEMSR